MNLPSLLPEGPDPVLAWARSLPADQIIGHTFDVNGDPFVAYLHSTGVPEAGVGWLYHWTNRGVWKSDDGKRFNPLWVTRVEQAMDLVKTRRPVTAGVFVAIVERCAGVRVTAA